ncbi:MAG: GNAT family N-acetyltransferase [Lachnospiraceae bacterium]|nr:GNAT family N-acetyltransferase [Lachnospiraceae bacterium]
MKVLVRKATLSEIDILMEWRMRVLREVFPLEEEEDRSLIAANNEAYYKKHLTDDTHTACFALDEENDRIIGCGGICYQNEMPSPDNLSGTNGYLMNIYTLPEVRQEGVGRKIIEFLIDDANSRGTEKIFLESSGVAKRLYHEIGFSDMKDYMKLEG